MPPNPRVAKAYRAMKDIGISEAKVKPVLKNLLKLYDRKWELIEEENYRALADAIFEYEEAEAAESKKSENIEQEDVLEEEAVPEEPERPLKRLRLRHQEGQASSSANNSSSVSAWTSVERPEVEEEAELPGTNSQLNNRSAAAASQSVPCLTYARNKGKQPVSPKALMLPERSGSKGKETQTPQIMSREKSLVLGKSSHPLHLKEPKTEAGIELSPKQKMSGTHALIKPKDEPYTLDMPQFEAPIAVILPEPSKYKDSSSGNASRGQPETSKTFTDRREAEEDIPTSSNGVTTSHELLKAQNGCNLNLDIASSNSGEVKVYIGCDSALGRTDFHLPSLEAVLKLVEDKCLKSYKALDPNFSVTKLMKDMCECFLELGTQRNHELEETTNVDAENDNGYKSMVLVSSNGSISLDHDAGEAQPLEPQLPPRCNGYVNSTQTDQTAAVGRCGSAPEIDQDILDHVTSQYPVALCGSKNFENDAGEAQPEKPQHSPPCNGYKNSTQTDQTAAVGNRGSSPEIDQEYLDHATSQNPVALCRSKILELDAGDAQPEKPQLRLLYDGHDDSTPTARTAPVENCDSAPGIDQNILDHVTSQNPIVQCGSKNLELDSGDAHSEKPQLSPLCNGHNNSTLIDQRAPENCDSAPEIDQNILEYATSQSPVALCEPSRDEKSSCLVTDITKGHEKVMISLVNEVNNKSPPPFHYVPQNVFFQNAYVNFSLARIGDDQSCSTCSGDCLSLSTPCACAYESGGDFAYTKEGLVKEELLKESISMNRDPKKHCQFFCKECPLERSKNEDIIEPCKGHLVRNFIKECWWKCGCNKQCGNRVVQRGISRKLQVFMTRGKGWGLRTLEDLPRGAFICEYVGEVLTNAELFDRVSQSPNIEEHSYPVLLDADWGSEGVLKDEEALCLDATFYGNVARFINHRCYDSNMVEIPVEIETPDHHYYHLAFFTTRKIKAMEELTWDYGIDFDDLEHPVKAFKCQCGSKFCRNMKRPRRSRPNRGW